MCSKYWRIKWEEGFPKETKKQRNEGRNSKGQRNGVTKKWGQHKEMGSGLDL